jgi:predicted membrane protein
MRTRSLGTVLFGILIIGLGLGFLLDSLNVLQFGQFITTWWPSIIIIVGLLSLISNRRQFLWPLLIVAAGVLLQLQKLNVIQVNAWRVIWPLAIIFFGLSLLFSRLPTKKYEDIDEDKLDIFLAFSGQNARSTSKQFTGGRMTALFGGAEVDLTQAQLKDNKADLDVMALFGGLEIRVPETWAVKVTGLPIFGGWENKAKAPVNAKDAPVLHIHGTCMFGGVSVKTGPKTD